MLDVCHDWGGMTLGEWWSLPRADRVMRLARHRFRAQPLTAEEQRAAKEEQVRAERKARIAKKLRAAKGL